MDAEIVRDIGKVRGSGARQCLVRRGEDHFVVSSVTAFDHGGFETLVFRADSEGEVTDWCEVAGGIGMDREQAIADLESKGPRERAAMDSIIEAVGGPLALATSTLSALVVPPPEDTDDRF